MFDDSIHSDSFLEGPDEFIPITSDLEEEWFERSAFEPAMKTDVERQKPSQDFEILPHKEVLVESVKLFDAEVQTDFDDSTEKSERAFTIEKIEVACQCDIWTHELFNLGADSPMGVVEHLLCDVEVQTDFQEFAEDVSVQKIETAVQCSTNLPAVERSAQCNILEIETPGGDMIIKLDADNFGVLKFKKIKKCKDTGIQVVPDEVNNTSDLERVLPDNQTSLHDTRNCGINKNVQCNIIEILTHQEEILEIFTEFKTRCFKEIPISSNVSVQTEIDVTDNDVIVSDTTVAVMSDDVNSDDVKDDVMCNEVREKHDGEVSEKTLLGLGWKDFVDGSELGDDAKHLDCIVYEKEDVFIVICESYRKYCKEISSDDYTFDFDNDAACDEVETYAEDEMKYPLSEITSNDYTIVDKVDSQRNLDVDDSENIFAGTEHVPPRVKTAEEEDVETCDIGIQCNDKEGECVTVDEVILGTCPHCLKSLSASPEYMMLLGNNTEGESNSFPGGADRSMLYSQFNVAEMDEDDELELIDECQLPDDFGFREMCDFSVQCVLDKNTDDLSHSFSCRDIGIQHELRDVLSSDDTTCSVKNISCLSCGHRLPSCSEKGIQCEFADLLSSSNGMLDMADGVLQEDEGESLIKEVMALAKECSQNDALIDQHLSEVVRGQGLFCQIQDGKNSDPERIPSSDEQSPDLYTEIPNSQILSEDEEIVQDSDTIPEQYEIPSKQRTPHSSWKEFRDVETQCGGSSILELREEKAVQCAILDEVVADHKVCVMYL